jgi:calcineurin-like phosphoesterase family protein
MRVWNHSHHGSWHLFGHSHGTLTDDTDSLSLDVGVDCWGYSPVSMEQLDAKMATKTFKPVDHHDDEPGKE